VIEGLPDGLAARPLTWDDVAAVFALGLYEHVGMHVRKSYTHWHTSV
jgi:hypothetical protein